MKHLLPLLFLSFFGLNSAFAQPFQAVVELNGYDSNANASGTFWFEADSSNYFTYQFDDNGRIGAELQAPVPSGFIYFEFQDCLGERILDYRYYEFDTITSAFFTFDWCEDTTEICTINAVVELSNYEDSTIYDNGSFYLGSNSQRLSVGFDANGRASRPIQGIPCNDVLYFEYENCRGELITLSKTFDANSNSNVVMTGDWCTPDSSSCDLTVVVELENFQQNADSALAYINEFPNELRAISFSPNGRAEFSYSGIDCEGIIYIEYIDCSGNGVILENAFNANVNNKVVLVGEYCGNQPTECVARFEYEQAYAPDSSKIANEVIVYDVSETSNGDIISWRWDFGDGEVSEQATPSHTYSSSGPYMLCLTITSDSWDQCTSTYCDTLEVDENGNVRAGFNITVVNSSFTSTVNLNQNELTVYPNPVQSNSTLMVEGVGNKQFKILNLLGGVVATGIVNHRQIELGNFKLTEGLYILQIDQAAIQVAIIK